MDTLKRTLKVIEWEKILEQLSKHATSKIGKDLCLNAAIYSEFEKIKHEQTLTSEGKYLLDHNMPPPLGGIRDIESFIEIAKTGQILQNYELIDIAHTIKASRLLRSFFFRIDTEAPNIYQTSKDLFENRELEESIFATFDDSGNVNDNASPELRRLRMSLKDQTNNLKAKLNSLMQSSQFSKYLQEPVYTQRNDRFVFPVKVELKASIDGIVHDVSSSGATVFIEPRSIIELNNNLKETEVNIENEIKRILADLSSKIKENADSILYSLVTLAEIDFIFAKAKYSIELKAIEPKLNSNKFIEIKGFKHPILLSVLKDVIPNDIELGKTWNTLVITGSNTGGKTIILKSVGICTLMTKAGLHIPALDANIYPFEKVFADIGDEQSVIQSLSTFSGHMVNIIGILNKVDNNSLVLLDELGSGTDPSEGSALAQSILEHLNAKDAKTIITTHYGELKSLAYISEHKEKFQNASVEFNSETLTPTYKLLIGIPGKSNAITIAKNLGLNKEIAENAQKIYFTQKDQTGEVLEGLQNKQQELSKNVKIAEETRESLEDLERDYNEKLDKINQEKKRTINIYKKKFETELKKAKDEIKDVLDEIRRTKSEKVARRSLQRLGALDSNLVGMTIEEQENLEPQYTSLNWEEIKEGDKAYLKDLKQEIIIVSLPDKNNNVQIQMGSLKTTVKVEKLVKADNIKTKKKADNIYKPASKGYKLTMSNISNTLDLRGVRVDDALDEVEYYLDKASLANLSPIYIIHGHGTGALREAIRDYLKTSPYVKDYRPGENAEGGDGVSVVEIK